MSITSFDHFIETLEHVPPELQRNFTLIADLDKRTLEKVKSLNQCVRNYRKTRRKDERMAIYKESMDLFEEARAFAEDKVDIANQTYNLIDKHIRCLENLSGAQNNSTEQDNNESSTKVSAGQKRKGGRQQQNTSNGAKANGEPGTRPLAVDMPLDPNEPRYCTCQQVSFGEMIACDNEDCPIEWFHFACVNLKSKPKGKWYCPECFNINKKGKHKPKR